MLSVAGEDGPPFRFWCLRAADASKPMAKGEATDRGDPGDGGRDRQASRAGRPGRGPDRRGGLSRAGTSRSWCGPTPRPSEVREALLGFGVASVQLGEASVFESHEAAGDRARAPGRGTAGARAAGPGRAGHGPLRPGRQRAGGAGRGRGGLGDTGRARSTTTRPSGGSMASSRCSAGSCRRKGWRRVSWRSRTASGGSPTVLHLTELLQAAAGADHLGMEGLSAWLAAHRQNGESDAGGGPAPPGERRESGEDRHHPQEQGPAVPGGLLPLPVGRAAPRQGRRAGRAVPRPGRREDRPRWTRDRTSSTRRRL